MLQHCLAPPSALPVRLAAMHAAVGLAAVLDTPVARRELQELVQPMLGVLGELLNAGDEESAQEALELFVELADNDARIMRRHFAEVAGAMVQIAEASAFLPPAPTPPLLTAPISRRPRRWRTRTPGSRRIWRSLRG